MAIRKTGGVSLEQFERAIDEIFDALLVEPWGAGKGEAFERAELVDLPDHYEVGLEAQGVDPDQIGVEIRGQRLTVRAPAGVRGRIESSFTFHDPIDPEGARAEWSNGILKISVPKHKARRIALKEA